VQVFPIFVWMLTDIILVWMLTIRKWNFEHKFALLNE